MVYTLLLCLLGVLIFLSNRNNRANQWAGITTVVFSLGAFKEYFFYELYEIINASGWFSLSYELTVSIYSCMTAALYLFAMIMAVIFALHFSDSYEKYKKYVGFLFLTAIILCFIFKPHMFMYYQKSKSPFFWYTVSIYNISLGIIFIILLTKGIKNEINPYIRRQKKFVVSAVLPPVIYWLITIFVVHSLNLQSLFKIWKANAVVLLVSIIFFLYTAFKEGMMGLKLKSETYRWNSDMTTINKDMDYISHMFKNETAKIEWCINNLEEKFKNETSPEEIKIIKNSMDRQKSMLNKIRKYSGEVLIFEENCDFCQIIADITNDVNPDKQISIINKIINLNIICDKAHIYEVFFNIISNSIEAESSEIKLEAQYKDDFLVINVTDNGKGMGKKTKKNIFEPYFTTKQSSESFGLGLSYCANVMFKHKGYIEFESEIDKGTTASIAFPAKKCKLS